MTLRPLFPQTVIAILWDFDKTLAPGYMQGPLFRRFGVDESAFWKEVNETPKAIARKSDESSRGARRVNSETMYLNQILAYVQAGVFEGLSNRVLRELGGEIEFFPGVPDVLARLKNYVAEQPELKKFDIQVEHYVVSTGLREMIVGSRVFPYLDGVWGCEFAEELPPPTKGKPTQIALPASEVISQVVYAIDNTTKTRAVFEINKGTNKHPDKIDVNSYMRLEDRRVPIENMIYVADGPSDIPIFSVVRAGGGRTLAVYPAGDADHFRQANELQEQKRVNGVAEANYEPESHACLWLEAEIDRIASRIVSQRSRELDDQVGRPARHLVTKEKRPTPERPDAGEALVPVAERASTTTAEEFGGPSGSGASPLPSDEPAATAVSAPVPTRDEQDHADAEPLTSVEVRERFAEEADLHDTPENTDAVPLTDSSGPKARPRERRRT